MELGECVTGRIQITDVSGIQVMAMCVIQIFHVSGIQMAGYLEHIIGIKNIGFTVFLL